jgi:hypothetical protein
MPKRSVALYLSQLRKAAAGIIRLVAQHSTAAWGVALLSVFLITAYPALDLARHDFPNATWHNANRGIDVEMIQARAAVVGWKDLLHFWWGPYIDYNLTYRPLSAWLFTAEYHLLGNQDRLWCWVSLALHLVVELLLVWVTAQWIRGPLAARLAAGMGAALALGAPGWVDMQVQRWIIGWWPSQPDQTSLICTLQLFGFTTLYIRTQERRWAWGAALAFLIGVCFKEMAYVGGVGACLLLLRRPSARPLLAALAGIGVAAFLFRTAIYHGFPHAAAQDYSRVPRVIFWAGRMEAEQLAAAAPHLGGILLAVTLFRAARLFLSSASSAAIAGAGYLGVTMLLLGSPLEDRFVNGGAALFQWITWSALLSGLWRGRRDWPVAEITATMLLALVMGLSFPDQYAWHRYWTNALGSIVVVLAAAGVLSWLKEQTRPLARSEALPSEPVSAPGKRVIPRR